MEADLERADAQVVAWDADDRELMDIFRSRADIHTENAIAIFNCTREGAFVGGSNSPRQKAKQGVHAVNYNARAKTLAATLGITVAEAERFIRGWFAAHPAIKRRHEQVWQQLRIERAVYNKFGFRLYYFDKVEEKSLGEVLAWIASSTVSITINKGLINVHNNVPETELLLQVHDSLLMQSHKSHVPQVYQKILDNMRVSIPYPDPLIIPVDISVSSKSWGNVVDLAKARKLIREYHDDKLSVDAFVEKQGISKGYFNEILHDAAFEPTDLAA